MKITVLGVFALGAIACGHPAPDPHASHASHASHAAASDSAPTDAALVSLRDLDATWQDQSGDTRTLMVGADDRIAVITMLYTSCTVSCPRLIADLKRVEGTLTDAERARTQFMLVSLDPARDTPERLARFAADLHLDAGRWTLLTGDDARVRELASVLRVRYLADATGEIMHTNRIVVANETGAIVHWQAGVSSGVPGTVAAIRAAIRR